MALEEEFETEIPDEDAEKLTTVQESIDYIIAHLTVEYLCMTSKAARFEAAFLFEWRLICQNGEW